MLKFIVLCIHAKKVTKITSFEGYGNTLGPISHELPPSTMVSSLELHINHFPQYILHINATKQQKILCWLAKESGGADHLKTNNHPSCVDPIPSTCIGECFDFATI